MISGVGDSNYPRTVHVHVPWVVELAMLGPFLTKSGQKRTVETKYLVNKLQIA